MIYVKATIKGEQDVAPFTKVFQYSDETDELILYHSAEAVKERLGRQLKINVNEALLVYCHYVAIQVRAKKRAGAIKKGAKDILSAAQVMIGVPETLRTIALDAIVDGRRAQVTLNQPIPATGYAMAAK
ncbi:MAG: urease subunit gamma [Nitrososphaera sp.]|uniref:urease subunit gamma n=1 Tax=Nitrososphaera sp. TaxID=1971748 RepID=UPI003D6DF736